MSWLAQCTALTAARKRNIQCDVVARYHVLETGSRNLTALEWVTFSCSALACCFYAWCAHDRARALVLHTYARHGAAHARIG